MHQKGALGDMKKRMNDFIKKIFCLPGIAVIILTIVTALSFIPVLKYDGKYLYLAYFIYFFYTYAFIVLIVGLVRLTNYILNMIRSVPIGKRFLEEKDFRGRVGLYFGGFINFLFILWYLLSGLYYRSIWFVSIAFFYLALVLGKRCLAAAEKKARTLPDSQKRKREIIAYIRTGALLLLFDFLICGMGVQVVFEDESYSYNQFLIYGVGAYAFYYLGLTIYNMVFYKKKDSYIWSAVLSVNFTTALLGIFTFQTALLAQFGTKSYNMFFNTLTLVGVLLIVAVKSVHMMIKGKVHIHEAND